MDGGTQNVPRNFPRGYTFGCLGIICELLTVGVNAVCWWWLRYYTLLRTHKPLRNTDSFTPPLEAPRSLKAIIPRYDWLRKLAKKRCEFHVIFLNSTQSHAHATVFSLTFPRNHDLFHCRMIYLLKSKPQRTRFYLTPREDGIPC